MLALRTKRRGHGGGSGTPEEPEEPPVTGGTAIAWGSANSGKLAGGYYLMGFFPFPQGVIGVSDIVQVGLSADNSYFVKKDGSVWTAGNNTGIGTAGIGSIAADVLVPVAMPGGVPLYPAEELPYTKEGGGTWVQPLGPVGPAVPAVAAVSGGPGAAAWLLTRSGRAMAWGSGAEGQLGNGFNTLKDAVDYEKAGQWPQFAPDWVRTGGPTLVATGSPKPGGGTYSKAESEAIQASAYTHILTGIRAIAGAEKSCYYLLESGEVYYSGQVAGDNTEHRFAEIDAVWAARPGGTPKAVAIAGTRFGYVLLLADGTVRYVGVNVEGTFGNGSKVEKSSVREISNPGLSKVTAVAKGEYFCMALKDNGKVSVWGSNAEGQLGQAGRLLTEAAYTPIELTLSGITAIAAGGVKRGNGANNGDCALVLLNDATVRTWGNNFSVGTGAGVKYLPWGVLGDGTSENRSAPVKPAVSGVTGIAASSTHMIVLGSSALPVPSLSATVVGKAITLTWETVPGTAGVLPVWRAPEGWQAKLAGPESAHSAVLPPGVTAWTSGALAAGEYQARVVESFITEEVALTKGTATVSGGKLSPVTWAKPSKPEPSYIMEIQRPGEDWVRLQPEIPGTATGAITMNVPPPKKAEAKEGETVNVRVRGAFEGSYKTRIVNVIVP